MSGPNSEPEPLGVAACRHCGATVPVANFCGACGAHLARTHRGAQHRLDTFAAMPEEAVLSLGLVGSLFPHLSPRSKTAFRVAFAFIVAVLVALAFVGREAPVIAVSALGVPLLFALYVFEIDAHARPGFLWRIGIALVMGAGLGVAWGLIGGPLVDDALNQTLFFSLTDFLSLRAAVIIPAVGVAATLVPVAVLRVLRRDDGESLDGFVLGSAGALGFTLASTLADLSTLLSDGLGDHQPLSTILTQGIVRGITVPVTAACTIGLFGAAIWARRRPQAPIGRRALSGPLAAVALALVLQIGLGFADTDLLSDSALIIVHLGAAAVAIVAMRTCLHHVLLHEHHEATIGAPIVCPHCEHLVPEMAFCPHCGVSRAALAPRHRARGPESATGWPTTPSDAPAHATFVHTHPDHHHEIRLTHRQLILVTSIGLAALSTLLIVIAIVLQPAPARRCHDALGCDVSSVTQGPPNLVFTSSAGHFRLEYANLNVLAGVHKYANGIELDYAGNNATQSGELAIAMASASGQSPSAEIRSVLSQVAPNAQLVYQIPNAFIGYQPAIGCAYNQTLNGSSNAARKQRIIIVAGQFRGQGVVVVIDGPYDNLNSIQGVEQATPAGQFAALFADPVINSIRWSGEQQP